MLRVSVLAMATRAISGFAVGTSGAVRSMSRTAAPLMSSFHDFSAKTIDGVETPMSTYKGKPTLILNVASL